MTKNSDRWLYSVSIDAFVNQQIADGENYVNNKSVRNSKDVGEGPEDDCYSPVGCHCAGCSVGEE